MINVSLECRKLMQSNTAFQEHVTITLADSTVLTIPQSDLIIQNNGITSGAGANAFPIGQASARTIRLEIANFDDKYSKYDFYGARIGLVVKYPLSNGTENFNYGYYTVITPETRGTTIKITAVDDMYKADKPYTTNISFPTTLLAIYNDACQTLGLTVQTASFTNSNFVVDKKPENVSFRQVLGGIAMFAGGNIYINREGRVEIKAYDSTQIDSWLHYDGGVFKPWETAGVLNGGSFNPWNTGDVADGDSFTNMLNGIHVLYAWISPPNVDTDDIVITGIRAETGADTSVLEGQEGYVLNVENPLIEGKEAAALGLIGDIVIGLKFRQFSGDYIGDPTIEFMDPCIVVDRKGNTYGSFVTDTDYSFRGKTSISNSAEPKIRTGISYSANDTKTMQKARALMDTRMSAYDAGIQMLTQLMNQSVGMYMTREIDANGSVIFYTHDQPTLAQSTIIRKVTGNGITQSVDGGQTWTSGIDASGNAVLNTLAAIGVNADWINAGQLVIRDGDGNETFFADTATGIVRINANSFRLTGETIEDIAKGIMLDPNNLLLEPIELPTTLYWLYGTVTRGQIDPYGGTNAIKLQPVSGGEGFISSLSTNAPAKVAGRRYQLKVWLRSSVDANVFTGNSIRLHLSGVASDDIFPTTNWNEYSMEMTATSSSDGVATICGMSSFTAADGYDLYVYNPRVYAVETQEEAFNRLTNDGALRGIYMENGFLYINMDYLRTGTVKIGGDDNGNGEFVVYNDSGNEIARINNEGAKFCTTTGWTNEWLKINENIIKGYVGNTQYSAIDFCANFAGNTKYLTIDAVAPAKGIRINAPEIFLGASPGSIILNSKSTFNGPATFDTVPTFSHSLKLKNANQVVDTNHVLCFDTDGTTVGHTYLSNGSSKRFKIIDRKMTKDDLFEAYKVHTVLATYKPGHLMKGDELEGRKMPMLIAEELEEHIPEAVLHDKEGLPNDYKDRVIVAIHQQMLVEQQKEIKRLNKKVSDLEARLSRLEELLNGNS